jgi:hypothetical protein
MKVFIEHSGAERLQRARLNRKSALHVQISGALWLYVPVYSFMFWEAPF